MSIEKILLETEQVRLALKPLSPCTLIEVPVECLQACQGRHSHYNAVISLPTHQHPACWVDPFFPLLLLSSLTRLTVCHSMFPLRNPEFYSDASLCPNTVAEDDIHPTSHSRKSIDNRFLFLLSIVLLLIFLPNPSLFAFYFFPNPVKWPYQVLRYVSDAATHAPTLRFGKEMSTKSRLQGRPHSLSTFFPVQKQRFSHWRALQCSLFVLCFASVLIPFWCKPQSYLPHHYFFV